jgi:protein-S-isoprenylcysteine O-methyltransferase Ste14
VTFRRHGTAGVPFHPATAMVDSGPYRLTRNPMYVGLAGSYVGCSLLLDSWWAFAMLPVVITIIDRQVIAREERLSRECVRGGVRIVPGARAAVDLRVVVPWVSAGV